MLTILRKPYAAALAATNLLVRLAGGAVALALVLYAQATRDSFGAAGLVAGCFAVGTACGAPVTGRLVDRLGATRVLLGTAAVHAAALLAIAALPRAPLGVAAAAAVLAGAARPPVAAWMRGIWVAILHDERERRASYRFESALLEIGFIAGPLVAGLVAALGRPALGLVLTAVVAAAATTVFALLPPARIDTRRPAPATTRTPPAQAIPAAMRSSAANSTALSQPAAGALQPVHVPTPSSRQPSHAPRVLEAEEEGSAREASAAPTRRRSPDVFGALRSAVIRTLVLSRTALGVTLGALQVAAAGYAAGQGRPGFAGLLLGGFAVGSLAGSAVLRLQPTVLAALMCAGVTLLLLPVGLWSLAALFAVAGLPLAPLNAAAYEATEHAAPPGTATEARTWTSTATMTGTALGTALAGTTVEHGSARDAVLVAIAGAVAAVAIDAAGKIGQRTGRIRGRMS